MSLSGAFARPGSALLIAPPLSLLGKKRPRSEPLAAAQPDAAAASDAPGDGAVAPVAAAASAATAAAPAGPSRREVRKSKFTLGADREDPARLARTLFVGNVPLRTTAQQLSRFFQHFVTEKLPNGVSAGGPAAAPEGGAPAARKGRSRDIESVRFRSVAIAGVAITPGGDFKAMLRAGFASKSFNPEGRDAMNAYIVFHSAEAARCALGLNGAQLGGKHLRVDVCVRAAGVGGGGVGGGGEGGAGDRGGRYDPKRTVFVGNLERSTSDEELRAFFGGLVSGGAASVEAVRIVRDKASQAARGIAYVLLRERSHVADALAGGGRELRGRPLRLSRCSPDGKPPGEGLAKHAHGKRSGPQRAAFQGEVGMGKGPAPQQRGAGAGAGAGAAQRVPSAAGAAGRAAGGAPVTGAGAASGPRTQARGAPAAAPQRVASAPGAAGAAAAVKTQGAPAPPPKPHSAGAKASAPPPKPLSVGAKAQPAAKAPAAAARAPGAPAAKAPAPAARAPGAPAAPKQAPAAAAPARKPAPAPAQGAARVPAPAPKQPPPAAARAPAVGAPSGKPGAPRQPSAAPAAPSAGGAARKKPLRQHRKKSAHGQAGAAEGGA